MKQAYVCDLRKLQDDRSARIEIVVYAETLPAVAEVLAKGRIVVVEGVCDTTHGSAFHASPTAITSPWKWTVDGAGTTSSRVLGAETSSAGVRVTIG
ncbi:MAG: hypothetical protein ACT4QB_13295 [Gammaproteobacteria bacterium]